MTIVTGTNLSAITKSGREPPADPPELAFRELFPLAQRARFAEAALKAVCATLDGFDPESVMARVHWTRVGPELFTRKIYFTGIRPWFQMDEMEPLVRLQKRQIEEDIGQIAAWSEARPALRELVDAICDIIDGVPAVAAARDKGFAEARAGYDQWIIDKRQARLALDKRRAADQALDETRARVITPKNARAAALLLQHKPIGEVAAKTDMQIRDVAELHVALIAGGLYKAAADARETRV